MIFSGFGIEIKFDFFLAAQVHDQEPAQASIRGSPDRVPPLQVRLPGLQPVPAPPQVFSLRGQATGQASIFLLSSSVMAYLGKFSR